MKKLMTGNEAIARGAYEAGVLFASAYPGTPSTEILENLATYTEAIIADWAPNEKVALEAVIGASLAGARTMASMKHVGVNVAADPLFTIAYMGVGGGLVLVSADEPGMHSSQNEQDNRNLARFAKIPMFEPSDSQEAKNMIIEAFELSETYDTPVLFRITTRVAHSKSIVTLGERIENGVKPYVKNITKNVPVPAFGREMRHKVERRLKALETYAHDTPLNFEELHDTRIGIITSGTPYFFAKEVFGDSASYYKVGFSYPLPIENIRAFSQKVDKLYVIEENDPIIETALKAEGIACHGRDTFPYTGEMTSDVIRASIFGETLPTIAYSKEIAVGRPPTLCAGCPHRGFMVELGKRKNTVISGDIGCYALAFAEPYNAMDFSVCMGASISMGYGAQKVFNMNPDNKLRVVTMLGDSTFFHTGINSLINTVYNKTNTINVILDNRITGMTGHQQNPGTGYSAQMEKTEALDIEQLVKAIGIKHVKTINPNQLDAVTEALNWGYALDEPSVIITRWPCVLKQFSEEDKVEFSDAFKSKCSVDHATCIGCKKCLKTGCPALSFDKQSKKASINTADCVGCTVCAQTCPVGAISRRA